MFRGLAWAAALLTAMALALALDRRFAAPAAGLEARVSRGIESFVPAGQPIADTSFDPARVAAARGLEPRDAFTVEWTGVLAVEQAGVHWFKLSADDEASLWIDGQPVIDDRTPMGADRIRGGSARLAGALHQIRVRYVQRGGDLRLRLSWATPEYREDWRGLPLYQPSTAARSIEAIQWRREATVTLASAWGLWLAMALIVGLAGLADRVWRLIERMRQEPFALRVVLLLGLMAIVSSIGWGLPPYRPWGLDEIMPAEVAVGLEQRFSNGWHDIYPPLHYVLLSLVQAPSLLLERAGWLTGDAGAVAGRHVSGRLLTALLGWSTLILVYLCACEAGARRAGPWAAACVLTLPFVYYAKTVNLDVPYVFWLTASFLFFLRTLRTFATQDCCGLAITAALAVCTKDQAYGFYPGMAFTLAVVAFQGSERASTPGMRQARLGALAAGLLTFTVVFVLAQNLPFNLAGFRAHVESITTTAGPGTYRMFPATARGLAELAGVTLTLIPWCLGWGVTVAAAAGPLILLRSELPGRRLLWLAAPVASYLLTFIAVVGYVYDRFLLGVLVVLALWAGIAFERLAQWRPGGRRVGPSAAIVTIALTIVGYAVSLNGAMQSDSRVDAEAWLRTHASDDPVVVGIGGQEYLPNLHPWRFRLTSARASEVLSWKADYIVVNEPLARRLGAELAEPAALASLEAGHAGYVRVFRQRTILPRFSLLRWTRWWRSDEHEPFTNLDKIGPTISIWAKKRG